MKPPFDYLPVKEVFRAVVATVRDNDKPHLIRVRLMHTPPRVTALGDATTFLAARGITIWANHHEAWIVDEHDPRYTAEEFAAYWAAAVELPPLAGGHVA